MDDKKYLQGYVKNVDEEVGSLEVAVASDETEDREGEVVKVDAWELKNFTKNPVMLWSHNAGFTEQRPPIGRIENLRVEGKKLLFKPVFDLKDSFAADIFRKFQDGFLSAFSVGFIPLARDEKKENTVTSAELLEVSAVNIPANPKALVSLREAGIPIAKDFSDWEKGYIEYADEKGVVGVHTTEMAEIITAWSGANARTALLEWAGGRGDTNFNKFKRGFAWFDSEAADTLGAYKLPHHTISNDKLVVVFRGVVAAMSALMGARGGTDIPSEDRKGVYNHLARHYKQFDREAPEFRMVEDQVLKDFEVENVVEMIFIEKKEVIDKEALKELIKDILPKPEVKKQITKKDDKNVFTSEDLRDTLSMVDKSVELALKKIKKLKGGEK